MPREAINVFDIEGSYAGGTPFAPGIYKIAMSAFGYFDFNKPGNDSLCLIQDIRSKTDDGFSTTPQLQYWPVMDKDKQGNRTVEPDPDSKVKGQKGMYSRIRLTESNTHDSLFKYSPFARYMLALQKAGFNMDSAGNDITALEDVVAEFDKQVDKAKPRTKVQEAEGTGGKEKEEYETIIIIGFPDSKETKDTKTDKKREKEPARTAKQEPKEEATPEELVTEYLEKQVCIDENEKGVPYRVHRLELAQWLSNTKETDADATKAAMAVYNDSGPKSKLRAILTSLGWSLDKDAKIISKD